MKRPEYKDEFFTVECMERRLGLGFNHRCTITSVAQDGWGKLQGDLYPGDQIIEINGFNFATLKDDALLKILAGPRPLQLHVKRPNEVKEAYTAAKMNEMQPMENTGSTLASTGPGIITSGQTTAQALSILAAGLPPEQSGESSDDYLGGLKQIVETLPLKNQLRYPHATGSSAASTSSNHTGISRPFIIEGAYGGDSGGNSGSKRWFKCCCD